MSVLTKVFVVLVTFLSILLVALIIPFVAKTEDYRAKLQAATDAKARAEVAARNRENEITQLQSGESERYMALNAKNKSLTETITTLSEAVAAANIKVQELRANEARAAADLSRLSASHDQFAQITEGLQIELGQRRDEEVKSKGKILELTDRNNELENQLDTLSRSVRQFKEKIAQLEGDIETRDKWLSKLDPATRAQITGEGSMATAVQPPHTASTPIAGHVTMVKPLGDDLYVQIDVGQNDGVDENMKFLVHRGETYLGNLVILKVDTDESAGKMILRTPGAEIASGDAVLSGDPSTSAGGNM